MVNAEGEACNVAEGFKVVDSLVGELRAEKEAQEKK